MKKLQIIAITLFCFSVLQAQKKQVKNDVDLKMISDYSSDNEEVRDILQFEGIEYHRIKFIGSKLKDKGYLLIAKEIWDGEIISQDTVVNSAGMPYKQFQKINDTVFNLKVISKLTDDNKLKMTFKFPRFSVPMKYDAIKTDDYSLRNLAEESNLEIKYNEKFTLLAYILPYEREDGSRSWCDVGTSGKDIENWGKKFGIKHYILFEMKFE